MSTLHPASEPAPALMALDEPLACACEKSGLQIQISVPDFFLLYCPRCHAILAGQPVAGDNGPTSARVLTLADDESAQVRQAVRIEPQGPLGEALQLALACTLPAALRVAQQRLGQRSGFLKELQAALYGSDPQVQALALRLVARTPEVPRELRHSAVSAAMARLHLDPLSDEVQEALMALHPLAGTAQHLRARVESIRQKLTELDGDRAALSGRIAGAVLAAMDRAGAAAKERFAADRDRLAALVLGGQLAEARALLARAYPEDDPDDPDGGMTGRSALCEAAAQALQTSVAATPQVRTLLSWALEHAEVFASWASSGGEGLARMVDVDRLRGRLRHLA